MLFFYLLAEAQDERTRAKSIELPISTGLSYGRFVSFRTLKDNPRYEFTDPSFTDQEFLEIRNNQEVPAVTTFITFRTDYQISKKIHFQSGLMYSTVGENMPKSKNIDPSFNKYYLSLSAKDKKRKNRFTTLEIPLLLEFKLAPNKRYNTSKSKDNLPGYTKKFTALAGLGFGRNYGFNTPYEYYSASKTNNFIVRTYAGLGYTQTIKPNINLSIRALARYTYTTQHKFEPVNANYYDYGLDVGLLYQLKKGIKINSSMPITECFSCGTKSTQSMKPDWGIIYGLNYNFVFGTSMDYDTNSTRIYSQFYGDSSIYGLIGPGKINYMPYLGKHFGFHLEFCFLDKVVGVIADFIYTEKGFNVFAEHPIINDTLNLEKFRSESHFRFDYFDLPISIRIKPFSKFYMFFGANMSLKMSDKFYNTMVLYKNFPDLFNTDQKYSEPSPDYYFGNTLNIMVLNYHHGFGYIFNNRLDLQVRIQKGASLVQHEDYQTLTGMISLLYFIGKRDNL